MRRPDLPAKNDDEVYLLHRVASFAGKPRSYRDWGKARKMAVILKQNGGHWPPFSASVLI
jgi:hypothetical protein